MRIYYFVHYFTYYFLPYFAFLSLALSISYSNFVHCSPHCMAHSHEYHDYRPVGTCLCPCSTEKEGKCVPGRHGQACGHPQAAGYGANVSPVVIVGNSSAITSMGNGDAGKSRLNFNFWNSPSEQLGHLIQQKRSMPINR